ncbi:MAG: hypothetical protein GEU82_14940 [Luteitalea sp.]|nr:hypothetical protein [Luteitalea sp.]
MTTAVATTIDERPGQPAQPTEAPRTFRLRPIMRQGTASSIPETWARYATLEEARQAIKPMYHNDRVLRVFVVTDEVPPRFVEWVER